MREGSLEAPTRHIIDWTDPDFLNAEKIDEEMRRVFDVCHGCRRCFNLCDSFPKLFDLVDTSSTGELDAVESTAFAPVVEACTLCDMCFMTKCPYVPPHEFNLDFPHLMLRYRAAEFQKGSVSTASKELAKVDRNGKVATTFSGVVNWAAKNTLARSVAEHVFDIHKKASVPKYAGHTFVRQAKKNPLTVNVEAPAFGRKVVIYATCFANYNNPDLGMAARAVLAHNGVESEVVYPGCCAMPSLEQGDIAAVAKAAKHVAAELRPWIEKGYEVVSLIPSCSLMLKSEWPLILPNDDNVILLKEATYDISQYIIKLSKEVGLASGLKSLGQNITLHIACHSRAQNIGNKAAEMLRLIPDTEIQVIERCSGHGGIWGMMKDNFEVALKVGKPVVRQALKNNNHLVLSECPLAADHIIQGIEQVNNNEANFTSAHPIEIFAKSYGLV
jgi:glycerol-3-phosphate dehydrogenase subunit C